MRVFIGLLFCFFTSAQAEFLVDDMVFDEESFSTTIEGADGYQADLSKPWPGGIVPLRFHSSVPQSVQDLLWQACSEWGLKAKIQCVQYQNQSSYVWVIVGKGCSSLVGFGRGARTLSLGRGCWDNYRALHELGHALGLVHEHMRPDRDQFVEIAYQNIDPQLQYAFVKMPTVGNTTYYDFYSVMHYPQNAFSRNGRPTILPRPGFEKYGPWMGRVNKLSEGDHTVALRIYGSRN